MGERFKREGIYVYLWLIHIEIFQKKANFCKAVILQSKLNKFFKIQKIKIKGKKRIL